MHSLLLRHPHNVDVGTRSAIADAELGGDVHGGDPGVRCAEAIDDEAVADLPGALPRIAEATWWSLGTGAALGGVTANPAAGGQGERESGSLPGPWASGPGSSSAAYVGGVACGGGPSVCRCMSRVTSSSGIAYSWRRPTWPSPAPPLGQWSRGHIRRRRARRRVEIRCGGGAWPTASSSSACRTSSDFIKSGSGILSRGQRVHLTNARALLKELVSAVVALGVLDVDRAAGSHLPQVHAGPNRGHGA